MKPLPQEGATERYDRLADEFYRETGVMAPGKDVPAAMGTSDNYDERAAKWRAWLSKRRPSKESRNLIDGYRDAIRGRRLTRWGDYSPIPESGQPGEQLAARSSLEQYIAGLEEMVSLAREVSHHATSDEEGAHHLYFDALTRFRNAAASLAVPEVTPKC